MLRFAHYMAPEADPTEGGAPPPQATEPTPQEPPNVSALEEAAARAKAQADEAERLAAEAARQAQEARERAESVKAREEALQGQGERYDALLSALEEREARFAARERAEMEAGRIQTLRRMGATSSLSDAQILALAPDVDPTTAEGQAKLDEWRESNLALFAQAKPDTSKRVEALRERIPERPQSKLWGKSYQDKLIAKFASKGM